MFEDLRVEVRIEVDEEIMSWLSKSCVRHWEGRMGRVQDSVAWQQHPTELQLECGIRTGSDPITF